MTYGGGLYAYWLISGLIFGFLCLRIWSRKGGSPALGFVIGFFLGLIGLIILALMRGPSGGGRAPATRSRAGWACPYCAQDIPAASQECPFCGRTLPLRSCPYCNYNTLATSETCGACGKRSEAWKLHNGQWWKREVGVVYVFDEPSQTWKPIP